MQRQRKTHTVRPYGTRSAHCARGANNDLVTRKTVSAALTAAEKAPLLGWPHSHVRGEPGGAQTGPIWHAPSPIWGPPAREVPPCVCGRSIMIIHLAAACWRAARLPLSLATASDHLRKLMSARRAQRRLDILLGGAMEHFRPRKAPIVLACSPRLSRLLSGQLAAGRP